MLNLISIELMKIYRKPSTWIMSSLFICIIIVFSILSAKFMPENQQSVWGLMQDSSFLISFLTLLTIIVAGGIVAGEFTTGTIKLLLIRPVSRTKILAAKFLTTFIFAFLLILLLFILTFMMGLGIYGFGSLDSPVANNMNGELIEENHLLFIVGLYGLNSINLIIMTTLAFMISSVFRSSSLAIGLSIFLNFIGAQIAFVLMQYEWMKYFLFSHTDLTQHFYREPLMDGLTLSFSIFILFIYFAIFISLSWIVFKKRDVTA